MYKLLTMETNMSSYIPCVSTSLFDMSGFWHKGQLKCFTCFSWMTTSK